jgi:hypothetical protein
MKFLVRLLISILKLLQTLERSEIEHLAPSGGNKRIWMLQRFGILEIHMLVIN